MRRKVTTVLIILIFISSITLHPPFAETENTVNTNNNVFSSTWG